MANFYGIFGFSGKHYLGSALVRDYRLAYEANVSAATGRSRLASVQECLGDGACLGATTFGSQGNAPGLTIASTSSTWLADSSGWNDGQRFFTMDVNGDGKTDLVSRAGSGDLNVWSSASVFPDLLTSITPTYGPTTTLTYKPLTDTSVYTKETSAVYRVKDVQSPIYVVSSFASSNGVGATNTIVGLLILLLKVKSIEKLFDSFSNGDPFVLVIAMLLLVVALAFIARFRKKMTLVEYAKKQEPVITVDESGFFDHRYMAMPIPWNKVAGSSYELELNEFQLDDLVKKYLPARVVENR